MEEYIHKFQIKLGSFSELMTPCLFINRSKTYIQGCYAMLLSELIFNKKEKDVFTYKNCPLWHAHTEVTGNICSPFFITGVQLRQTEKNEYI